MKTQVCTMLGIELPIFAFSHCRDVVAEVSKAGGMGVLGVSGFSPEQLEQELAWIDEHIEGRPYAVDILIPNRYEQSAARLQALPPLPEVNQRFSASSVTMPAWLPYRPASRSVWSRSTWNGCT